MSGVFRRECRTLSAVELDHIDTIKRNAEFLHAFLCSQGGGTNCEFALARTKLEECVMWATKAITG